VIALRDAASLLRWGDAVSLRIRYHRGVNLRRLVRGDEEALEARLAARPDTTMFLRSNLARAGIEHTGEPYSGTYVGLFDDEELASVGAHYWNDNIVLSTSDIGHVAPLTRYLVDTSKRRVAGLFGVWNEVTAAKNALHVTDEMVRWSSRELLFALRLDDLVVPRALDDGSVSVREPHDEELAFLLEWRMEYCFETMRTPDDPMTRAQQKQVLDSLQKRHHHFVALDEGGSPVAYSAFNATLPDIVQIGGVWTPKPLRNRGYARAAVSGSLLAARARDVARAVLFTPEDNVAAQRSYAALGFRVVGDYGLVFVK
jgi:uncharacterized protein